MQDYLEAVRRRVCSVCIDGIFESDGRFLRCGLPSYRRCPIESYLPLVVEVVESVDSPKAEDYIELVREQVCKQCIQDDQGECELRLKADCALDRYFILVAEAIDEVRARRDVFTANRTPTPSV